MVLKLAIGKGLGVYDDTEGSYRSWSKVSERAPSPALHMQFTLISTLTLRMAHIGANAKRTMFSQIHGRIPVPPCHGVSQRRS